MINQRGQVFSTDLLLSLVVVVAAIGLLTQALELHYRQTTSTFENAKMHQIALDAAAIEYYNMVDYGTKNNSFFNESVELLGYHMESFFTKHGDACVGAVRGTKQNPVEVFICRG